MTEIAFTIFCFAAVLLVLTVACSVYAVKLLETCRDFLDNAWNLTHYDEPKRLEGADDD